MGEDTRPPRPGELTGFDAASFVERTWQQRPALLRGALAGIEAPLDPAAVLELAQQPDVESRLVQRHPAAGSDDTWTVTHGPLDPMALAALPEGDWSVLVHAVDRWIDAAADFLERFRFVPNWRLDDLMVSLAPPGASVGAHVDAYDVFLVQAAGRRRWEIESDVRVDPVFRPNLPLRLLETFEPDQTFDLDPGDVLYLPPGIPHHGIAIDTSLTLSVGFRAPDLEDVVTAWGFELMGRDLPSRSWSDPGASFADAPGELGDDAVSAFGRWIDEVVADPELRTVALGKLLTRGRASDDVFALDPDDEDGGEDDCGEDGREDWRAHLAAGGALRRLSASRWLYRRRGQGAWLFVGGRCYNAQPDEFALVERLTGPGWLERDALSPWIESAIWSERLDEWVARGELLLVDSRDDDEYA